MPDKVWIASALQESTFWEAFDVFATPEIAMQIIDQEDRADRQRLLNQHDAEYPPEMEQRPEIVSMRAGYVTLVSESIIWEIQRDIDGNITECYGDPQGYGTDIQIAPFTVRDR